MQIAKKTNKKLWEKSKALAIKKEGGKFSARAMQEAVRLYKKSGGTFQGHKTKNNSLVKWTKEEWDYIGQEKHSRYLPKKAAKALTRGQKAATSRAKNLGTQQGKQWVKQPKKIATKTAKFRK